MGEECKYHGCVAIDFKDLPGGLKEKIKKEIGIHTKRVKGRRDISVDVGTLPTGIGTYDTVVAYKGPFDAKNLIHAIHGLARGIGSVDVGHHDGRMAEYLMGSAMAYGPKI